MTKKQLQHYLSGGHFLAKYNPIKMDIPQTAKSYIGKKIIIWQNMLTTPIIDIKDWLGQFRFNSDKISGWFPEEDITILEILDDYKDFPEPLSKYMYRLTYTKQEKLFNNFGTGSWKIPMIVGREYSTEQDAYIMKLSKPQACKIEKFVWNGEEINNIKWKTIYSEVD